MHCYAGQILRVDLTRGECRVEELDTEIAEKFMAGRGMAVKMLYDELDPKVEPLSPENKLIFTTGLLNGTNVVASARFMVVTKSPLTNTICCPNSGGYFGAELKFAGYDMIIIEGKSPKPVYLSIENDDVQIKPAEHLWGKTTGDTEDMIRTEKGDEWKARETHIACIGPAGEKLVRMACIMHAGHAAGRSGTGAVMGSKNLKAIAVRGTKGISVANAEGLRKAVTESVNEKVRGTDRWKLRVDYGTWVLMELGQTLGELATRNFREGYFEGFGDKFPLEEIAKEYRTGVHSCYACPYATHKVTRVRDPEFQGCGVGPEHETLGAFGSCCGISNFAAITKAGYICNDLGIDTIDVGVSIACAMELYENGFLPEKDVGYKLNFGNVKAMVELTEKTGLRQGFGDVLAEGGYKMAEKYGHPELFMGVKKQAMPMHHPQATQSFALAYATSNMGGNHCKAQVSFANRFESEGQATFVKEGQDWITLGDCAGLCWSMWGYIPFGREDLPLIMENALGVKYTVEDLLLIGERVWNLERLFNQKVGFTYKDDTLPKRMLEDPMPSGASKGYVAKISEMLPEYYELRGWDKKGVPTPEKLAQLGLD